MPSMLSSAATKCISDVPGFAKQTSTPLAISVRTRLSAPFMARDRKRGRLDFFILPNQFEPGPFSGHQNFAHGPFRMNSDGGVPSPGSIDTANIVTFDSNWSDVPDSLTLALPDAGTSPIRNGGPSAGGGTAQINSFFPDGTSIGRTTLT